MVFSGAARLTRLYRAHPLARQTCFAQLQVLMLASFRKLRLDLHGKKQQGQVHTECHKREESAAPVHRQEDLPLCKLSSVVPSYNL